MSIAKGIVSPIFKQNLVSSIVRSILNIDETLFTPLDLFLNGEQGVWYDPSDLTTLFQDAAGTIPVAADGDPVGLMLDKSQGLELGPDKIGNATNLDPRNANSTLISEDATTIIVDSVASGTYGVNRPGSPSDVGKQYRVTGTLTSSTLRVVSFVYGGATRNETLFAGVPLDVDFVLNATTTSTIFDIFGSANSSGERLTVSNLSVRELKGNHATQSVAASRPVYQRGDSRGVVNLLKWTEDFDNAVWNKLNCTVTSGQADPGGGSTAWSITDDATDGTHLVRVNATPGSESTMRTYTVTVKGGTARYVLFGRVSSGVSGGILVFDTQTGTFSDTGSALIYDQVFTPVDKGNGWWEIGFNSDSNSILSTQFLVGISSGPTHETDWSYIGSGDDIYIWHPQMELGTTTTPYQRNDSHLGGVATGADTDLHWLAFDGVDDYLQTGAFATPLTQPATQVYGLANPTGASPSGTYITGLSSAARHQFYISSSGAPEYSLFAGAQLSFASVKPLPSTVYTSLYSGAGSTVRRDGVPVVTGDAGTQSMSGVTIGALWDGTFPATADFFGIVIVGASLSGEATTSIESYMAKKSGVTL